MNSEELKDFECFYGTSEEEAKKRDEYWSTFNSRYSSGALKEYKLNKFLYPMLQQDLFGTVIFEKCLEAGFHVSQNDVYRFKKRYKEEVARIKDRAVNFRHEGLKKMRAREMFYPHHYEYMVDPRTVVREMHALMPFKQHLFEVLTQLELTNE